MMMSHMVRPETFTGIKSGELASKLHFKNINVAACDNFLVHIFHTMFSETYEIQSCIRGHNVHKDNWTLFVGKNINLKIWFGE